MKEHATRANDDARGRSNAERVTQDLGSRAPFPLATEDERPEILQLQALADRSPRAAALADIRSVIDRARQYPLPPVQAQPILASRLMALFLSSPGRVTRAMAKIPPKKLTEYALHPTNSKGKSALWEKAGYTQGNWWQLSRNLHDAMQNAHFENPESTDYGVKYSAKLTIPHGDGHSPPVQVQTGWMMSGEGDTVGFGDDLLRMTTAYPMP